MENPDVYQFIKGVLSVAPSSDTARVKGLQEFGYDCINDINYAISLLRSGITPDMMAIMLNGKDLMNDRLFEEFEAAERNNLVVVTGYDDDMIVLNGAIRTAQDCYGGGRFHFKRDRDGLWVLKPGRGKVNYIDAFWCDEEWLNDDGGLIPWQYDTDIPCAVFDANFDGEIGYCRGLVFMMGDLV